MQGAVRGPRRCWDDEPPRLFNYNGHAERRRVRTPGDLLMVRYKPMLMPLLIVRDLR